MSKRQQFITLSLLLLISRCYDVYTTYLYIPDLQGETNILVRYFGAGWTAVILVQAALVLLLVYALYHYLFRFRPVQPGQAGLGLKEYVSYLHFGNTHSFARLFYALPTRRQVLLPALAYVATRTLIVSGFIVGSSTTLLLCSEQYRALYRMGIPYLLYGIIVLLAAHFSTRFYRQLYAVYQCKEE